MKEQPSAAMPETGLEIPLPSGAVFPDWSVVASATVRASLNATLGVLRMAKKWPGMGADEERVRLAVLTHYAEADGCSFISLFLSGVVFPGPLDRYVGEDGADNRQAQGGHRVEAAEPGEHPGHRRTQDDGPQNT